MLFLIICLIVAGTVAGGATMNPIILGIIPGSGLILITYCETKDFKKKSNHVGLFLLPMKRHVELRSFMKECHLVKKVIWSNKNYR